MPRRLRIAVSVCFALVAVAFAILWVRSYRTSDQLSIRPISTRALWIESMNGRIAWNVVAPVPKKSGEFKRLTHASAPPGKNMPLTLLSDTVSLPLWLPTVISAIAAGLPWAAYRFGLRTLFITTTLVAIFLGMLVYYSQP